MKRLENLILGINLYHRFPNSANGLFIPNKLTFRFLSSQKFFTNSVMYTLNRIFQIINCGALFIEYSNESKHVTRFK